MIVAMAGAINFQQRSGIGNQPLVGHHAAITQDRPLQREQRAEIGLAAESLAKIGGAHAGYGHLGINVARGWRREIPLAQIAIRSKAA